MKIYYLTFTLFYFLNLVQSESNLDCLKAENCSSCIQIVNCAWCLEEQFYPISGKKCDYPQTLINDGCPSNLIFNPINTVEIIEELDQEKHSTSDVSLTKSSSDTFRDLINSKTVLSRSNRNQFNKNQKRNVVNQNDKLVQLKPDKIKLKIRPNTKVRFNLTFNQAEKYPVDVYYLMDLTYSMKDHRDALIKQAEKISESMSDITTKFRLGFGSFVDKVTMPYANMLPQKLENPCNQNIPCVRAYGYKNHLSLTNDSKLFLEKVKEAKLSGNLDNAEGGFDALIQIISCRNEINWNYPSRKIILFATDSLFHYAGDGKLGGIVKRNDGKCHLNNDGYYTESLVQDYPSLEQINKAIVNNQINIIFSVPENALKVYEILSENLQGSITGRLAENSSNIVDLIRENYKKIVSTIELKDDSSKNVEIKYFSKCTSTEASSLKETNMCKDVVVGQKLRFEIELEVKSCEQFRIEKQTKFVIFPIGIEEKTEIELELICDCDCDARTDSKSDFCFGNGNLVCGVCECDSSFYGDRCQCSQNNLTSSSFIDECKVNNVICSNKGQCFCGKCLCDDKSKDGLMVYGRHCECDNYSCPKSSNGLTCAGRGRCCKSNCECMSGWIGDTCDCSLDQSTCVSPINNKICSGNGECTCGKCNCKRTQSGEIWTGRFCNECPTCTDECATYDPCALCFAFNTGPYKSNCEKNCKFDTRIVKEFSYLNSNKTLESDRLKVLLTNLSLENSQETGNDFESSLIKRCIMIDENNCKYEFTIIYTFKANTERIFIEVLSDKICPNVQNVFYFMSLIVLFIILIGLLSLIIWRAIVSYKDKKDYEKWIDYLKNRKFTSTGQNPLYKAPNTEIKNPLYESKNEN